MAPLGIKGIIILMNKLQIAARHRSVAAAVGSVRVEGLKPSAKTQKHLQHYADGKISSKELRHTIVWEIKGSRKAK